MTCDFGVPVLSIDRAAKRITFADGHADYETLFLSTGTRARDLPLPGARLDGVFSLRKIDDVRALRAPMDAAKHIVIVGGGYIGLEVAAVARSEGREVTVLEAEERVMKRVTSPVISAFHAELPPQPRRRHPRSARGSPPSRAARSLASETVRRHRTAGRSRAARGRREAERRSCRRRRYRLRGRHSWSTNTAAPPIRSVYAAGDCTRFPSRRYGRKLRLECVQNAIDQAKAVAADILGKPQFYDPVPWFWSDQYELKLQMAGLSDGYDDAQTVGDVAAARFSVEYRKDGKLIAVDAVNDGRAYMSGRKRIAEETA